MPYYLILLLGGGVILTIGDLVFKQWVVSRSNYLYIIGLLVYLLGLNFLAQSYKYEDIAVALVIFIVFNVVTLSIVGVVFYHEVLTPFEIIGILLGMVAIIFLEIK